MKKAALLKTIGHSLALLAAAGLVATVLADESHVPADYTGKPYTGTPQVIPGIIQAATYDIAPGGAKEITFSYHGDAKTTAYRTSPDSIGLAGFGNGHVSTTGQPEAPDQVYVGWTETGEWLKYTVRVAESGTYLLGGKFAAGGKGTKISVTFTPQLTTGPIEIPTTAGYQPGVEVYHVWEKLDHLAEITLPAGTFVMTFKIEEDSGLNLQYLSFTKKP